MRDDLTGGQLERAVLRSEGPDARKYRSLTGLFVLKAPSEEAWNEVMAPALKAAMESHRPIEALRSTMLGMGDSLLGSPSDSAVRITFFLPGDRGEGVLGLAAPVLLGPPNGKTGHIAPNRMRVVTGVEVSPVSGREPAVVEAIGLPNRPSSWTGEALRFADLQALPYGGEGAWVKYRGKVLEESDESDSSALEELAKKVIRLGEQDVLEVDRLATWPGRGGDESDLRGTLRSARYDSRVLDVEKRLIDELRLPEDSLVWQDKRIKHPTRFGVATLPVSAEVVVGRKLVERTEVFAFVYLYTPLFVPFDSAHLYLSVSPEVLVRSVQQGQLPFFLWNGKGYFYLGHLDRWLAGDALEPEGKLVSRRKTPDVIGQWAKDVDRKTAKELRRRGEDPSGWPVRLAPRKDDSERAYKVRVSVQDLGNWFHRLKSSIKPRVGLSKPQWAVRYEAECAALDLGELFGGGKVVLEEGAGEVSALPSGLGSQKEVKVTIQPEQSSGGRRDGAMSRDSSVDLRMKKVILGSPSPGKPHLLTRAGRTVPVKATYVTKEAGTGHKVRVVAQVHDPSGTPMKDFKSRSSTVTLKEGEGTITTYLKVPKRLYGKSGSYKVRTHLELDGVALGGAREEFLYLGSALTMGHMELDPSVVIPGEEVLLLLDLSVAGWQVGKPVPFQVDLSYRVGGATTSDSFKISRTVGSHQLEVDLRVPEELAEGDGTYKVVLSSTSGHKTSASGKLRVFPRELVAANVGRQRQGLSLRVEDDDSELLAAAKAGKKVQAGSRREVVRADRGGGEGADADLFEEAFSDQDSSPEQQPEPSVDLDDEEMVLVDEDEDLDLDFEEDPPEEDLEAEDEDVSLDFDKNDDEDEFASARKSRSTKSERGESRQPRRQKEKRWSSEDDEDDEPARLSEAQRRRQSMSRSSSSPRADRDEDDDDDARRTEERNRRAEQDRREAERREEEARRERERRSRAEKKEKEKERRRRKAARDEERRREADRSRDRRRADAGTSSSSSWGSNRRRSSSAAAGSSSERRRDGRRRSGSSSRYDDEDDSEGYSQSEDEEDLSSVLDEDEEIIIIEEDDASEPDLEEEGGGYTRRRRPGSQRAGGRAAASSNTVNEDKDSYWLSGSREDPDATLGGSEDDEVIMEGRSSDGLPVGVYSEDEESNAVSRALRRGQGMVWVYGGSEASLRRWHSFYEGVLEDGGVPWVWIFSEGAGGGEIRFKRFSGEQESWKTVYKVPASKSDRDGMRQVRVEVISVLDGYVPKLDRRVEFGRF